MADPRAQHVVPLFEGFEDQGGLRVADRLAAVVGHQVLLRDIGDVGVLVVLGQQMVERLVLARADFLGNGIPPLWTVSMRIYPSSTSPMK